MAPEAIIWHRCCVPLRIAMRSLRWNITLPASIESPPQNFDDKLRWKQWPVSQCWMLGHEASTGHETGGSSHSAKLRRNACIAMFIVENGRKSAGVQFHGEIVCKTMFLMNLHCVNILWTSWVDESYRIIHWNCIWLHALTHHATSFACMCHSDACACSHPMMSQLPIGASNTSVCILGPL